MNSNLKIYSDPTEHAEGGIWYPNAENFPAAELLWHKDDFVDGTATWMDRVLGNVITASAGTMKKNAAGVYRNGATISIVGAMPAMGKNDFMLIVHGQFSGVNANVEIGDGAGVTGASILAKLGANVLFLDADNSSPLPAIGGAPTYPFTGSHITHTDIANELSYGEHADDTTFTEQVTAGLVTGSINAAFPAFGPEITIPNTDPSGISLIAIMRFAVPLTIAEIKMGNDWMSHNVGKMYPGWARKVGI